ncbi:hypothetical protein BS78_01G075200 [Paspalum vaginatum]|nr:hypothetical protein BS78_01G075200 [Paspalum vaginatum]
MLLRRVTTSKRKRRSGSAVAPIPLPGHGSGNLESEPPRRGDPHAIVARKAAQSNRAPPTRVARFAAFPRPSPSYQRARHCCWLVGLKGSGRSRVDDDADAACLIMAQKDRETRKGVHAKAEVSPLRLSLPRKSSFR